MHRIAVVVTVFALILFGTEVDSGYTEYLKIDKKNSLEETRGALAVTFNEYEPLEYGSESLDTMTIVKSVSNGELEISQAEVSTEKVGYETITYTVSATDKYGQEAQKEYVRNVFVHDTVNPEISLDAETIDIKLNEEFDAEDNITSVMDAVDGDLILSETLEPGTYTISSDVDNGTLGTYTVTVDAMDINGNTDSKSYTVQVRRDTYNHVWDGTVLTPRLGTIYGPSGKETYYNLPMGGVVAIMRRMGNTDEYWVREDGVKMLGDYIMVAANLEIHPRGTLVETSLGTGLVCDTGGFATNNIYQIDIAVDW
ncbi:MAG: hypothetical protein IJJ19_05320 [Erysipelotrichaceae bacterium]|nr:hypothetical protein [Erysipelotrichaceae bacterium]